jgi:uncharacterized protein (TIRG00374 family)
VLGKIKKKIFISLGIAGLIYLAFTIYADYRQVVFAFSKFNWLYIPLILFFSFMNYIVRFSKWHYYLRLLKVKITTIDSFAIFMSGLIMSVTPGKMGELLKAYLVKQVAGKPISKTAPIIFAERITDFVSLVILGLIGAYIFNYGRTIVMIVGLFFLLVIFIISRKSLALSIIKQLEKISFFKKHLSKIHGAYESSYILLKVKPIILMTAVSLVSWFFECLGYYIVLINFGIKVSLMWTSFSYAFATIVGAISMLPGGLGVTEGSLTFLLIQRGISKDIAVASTFIIRVATLWFAVLVGVFAVTIYQKRYGKITIDSIPQN